MLEKVCHCFRNIWKYLIEKIYLSFDDNLVYYESVTHCKSRFYYDTVIRPKYEYRDCILVFVDINNLKKINNTLGHACGTQHIKNIANELRQLNNVDCVCRIGGDEFALICNICFTDDELSKIHGISYGIARKKRKDSFYNIIVKADKEMYKMKRAM